MTAAALAADQTFAHRLGNQLSYGNTHYSYDGKAAPSFFGYEGLGYGGLAEGFQAVVNLKSFTQPLFVVGPEGKSQVVNYRVRGSTMIVDRLFAAAELRLGQDPQQVVRISRTDGTR